MSEDTNQGPSLMKRLKPHLTVAVIGMTVGAVITVVIMRGNALKIMGDVWLSPRMLQQLKESGGGMFQIEETGQLVDLIDWAHPHMQKLEKVI